MRDKQEQLEWEARAGRLAGYAAWVAALLVLVTLVYRIVGLPHVASTAAKALPQVQAHKSSLLTASILSALAALAFVPPLLFLYEATRYRREELRPFVRILLIAGTAVFVISAIWLVLGQNHAADQFVHGTVKTDKHAKSLLTHSTTAPAALQLASSLAIAFATILISLNAMRAGLLSRFMGILGVILGALYVVPLVALPVIQLFWLVALGMLLTGTGPTTRGPAWATGEAVPWPSQSRLGRPAADSNGEVAAEEPEPEAQQAPAVANPNTSRKRRKKKARG